MQKLQYTLIDTLQRIAILKNCLLKY